MLLKYEPQKGEKYVILCHNMQTKIGNITCVARQNVVDLGHRNGKVVVFLVTYSKRSAP